MFASTGRAGGTGRAAAVFGLIAIQAAAVGARAQSPAATPIRFEYIRGTGAELCPDRAVVLTGIRARLGHDPFGDEGGVRVRCEIAGNAGGLRARVETWDRAGRSTGTRSLTSPRSDCSDLAEALLLVLTLASGPPGL